MNPSEPNPLIDTDADAKVERRRLLHAELSLLRSEIEEEKKRKHRIHDASKKIRERMDKISEMSSTLESQQKSFNEHVERNRTQYDKRTESIGDTGMLVFHKGIQNEIPRAHQGRHNERTAYCLRYDGVPIMGESEFAIQADRAARAKKTLEQREKEELAATATMGTSSLPRRKHNWESSSPLQALNYLGVPSLHYQDLSKFHNFSSRRLKRYTDYLGRPIMMDPCDWPLHSKSHWNGV